VPAAAVIPAPIAYIKVVAVKKLVVGSRGAVGSVRRRTGACTGPPTPSFWIPIPAIDLVGMLWAGRLPAVAATFVGVRLRKGACVWQGPARQQGGVHLKAPGPRSFTVKKLECSKQADLTTATEYISMG
jgi:hypothetical protein